MSVKKLPNLELLEKLFFYDKKTGNVIRRISTSPNACVGDVLSCFCKKGYRRVRINNKYYYVHRIVWKLFYKEEPPEIIDHINRNKSDNKIKNLRKATKEINQQNQDLPKNNTSGYRGVFKPKHLKGKYRAVIGVNGKYISLGVFGKKNEAIAARTAAEKKYYA